MTDLHYLLYFAASVAHSAIAVFSPPAVENPELMAAFVKLDMDEDGLITRKEAEKNAELLRVFRRADRNKDGKLDPEDYARARFITRLERPTPRSTPTRTAEAK